MMRVGPLQNLRNRQWLPATAAAAFRSERHDGSSWIIQAQSNYAMGEVANALVIGPGNVNGRGKFGLIIILLG